MFTVGAFSRLAGVSAKMLRAYDTLGLFRPVWVDPSSGYRYYSPAQLPEIRRILALRTMGIGLGEIGSLVGGGADLRAVLERRRGELEEERREIDRRLRSLDIRIETPESGAVGGVDVVVRPVEAETVATLAVDTSGLDVDAAFYELESHVRDLGHRAPRPPGALVDDTGRRDIFVPLRRPIAGTERIRCRRLPASRMATAIHRGPYDGLRGASAVLESWLAAAGLRRDGPLRVLYLQFGAEPELRVPSAYVVERAADFVTELQVPFAG